ncbi:MAG: aspartate aminotransferase family protein, partial [Thiothrix sp.]|nr:aspartate aminotransferase family protein [Thiothrix sp.]
HWMADWSSPFPLFVSAASGAYFTDVDGIQYADFCLGDTAAMFGHSPAPVAAVVAAQAAQGYSTMLPGEEAVLVGRELARRFGLPFWQVATTATDANRWAIRWARAVTGRETLLVFDGCYHGAVDETLVRLQEGRVVHRAGLLGQVTDLTRSVRVVEFNDLSALQAALVNQDVAAVLCEPVMTNIGMVLPDEGFLEALRDLTRQAGTLLIVDETHTIASGPEGYCRANGLEPDIFVLGKPVAGGLPASVFGVSAAVAEKMQQVRGQQAQDAEQTAVHPHSGMGTTLSANMFSLHAMRANLESVMTEAAFERMLPMAEYLSSRLESLIRRMGVPWSITQVGARVEFQFTPTLPRTGREAEAAFDKPLEQAIHLYLLNRNVMITPFHNMMLICPDTSADDIDRLVGALADFLDELVI